MEEWEGQVWTENRPDINTMLKNIQSLPIIRVVVTKWVMDRLKECLDDYVKQKWLSSIALAESISEYITAYFIQKQISDKGIFSILKDTNKIKFQRDRINLLVSLGIIDNSDKQDLELINDTRDKYLHVRDPQAQGIKEDCLNIINALNRFLTRHPIVTDFNFVVSV